MKMDPNRAHEIFNSWVQFMEIASKLKKIHLLSGGLPESLLPYPRKDIEEALNFIEDEYRKRDNTTQLDLLLETKAYFLDDYINDKKALDMLANSNVIQDENLRISIATALNETQMSWIKHKNQLKEAP